MGFRFCGELHKGEASAEVLEDWSANMAGVCMGSQSCWGQRTDGGWSVEASGWWMKDGMQSAVRVWLRVGV